jgi:hypothetical protein
MTWSPVFLLVLSANLWLSTVTAAQPPIVGRPVDFSGAIGGPFVVTMSVESATVAVEEPFTLTLRIVGSGNLKEIARPPLGKLAGFKPFAVDDLDDSFADGSPPNRTFHYRLRARSTEAKQIPPFKFVYFNLAIVPASRGYQTTWAEGLDLSIKRPQVSTPNVPDFIVREWDVEQLRSSSSSDPLDLIWYPLSNFFGVYLPPKWENPFFQRAMPILLPPVICLIWYVFWGRSKKALGSSGTENKSVVGLLVVFLLLQTPDRGGDSVSHGFQALDDAFKALRSEKWYRPADAGKFFKEAAATLNDATHASDLNSDEWTTNPLVRANLFRWLGHACLLSENLAGAIAAYRTGIELDPNDDGLRFALTYARGQVRYVSSDIQPTTIGWPLWLTLGRYSWLAFGCYFCGWIAVTRWWMIRRLVWLFASLALFFLAAIPAVGSLLEWRERARNEAEPIVVVAKDTVLRRGNGEEYSPRITAPLPPGAEVRRLFERHGWLQVELANGIVGWLPADSVIH